MEEEKDRGHDLFISPHAHAAHKNGSKQSIYGWCRASLHLFHSVLPAQHVSASGRHASYFRINRGQAHLRLSTFLSSLLALLFAAFSSTSKRNSSGTLPPSTLDAPPPRPLPAVSPNILLDLQSVGFRVLGSRCPPSPPNAPLDSESVVSQVSSLGGLPRDPKRLRDLGFKL